MGQVWRATHPGQNIQVAIKILHADFARHEGLKLAFYDEVRAVSGLDHPNIVGVLDYGEVTDSAGYFVPGCPWLAMEFVAGHTLFRLRGKLPWREARKVLLALLDALAHAHARGVIHRDLKPGNVLLGERVVLCDFGLAQAVDNICTDEEVAVGTPPYMAPEQFLGSWRDFGPWTDLYSLGCLAHTLICGVPPFGYSDLQTCRQGHLERAPPPLAPLIEVPEDVDTWLRILLAKDPEERFRRAADAAWALTRLRESPLLSPARGSETIDGDEIPTVSISTTGREALVFEDEEHRSPPSAEIEAVVPPMPRDWRRMERAGVHLRGAGLRLWGLRSIPMVNREPEREVLWGELRRVRGRGGARGVVLRGPSGCGKTRLADWLAERSKETGAALAMKATHDAKGGHLGGLGGMLRRELRCIGLREAGEILDRVREVLDRLGESSDDAEAIAEMIRPAGLVTFGGPTERYLVLERLVRSLARDRPLVLVLDDVQWGHDALGFARHLLGRKVPVLLVLTAREEALAERPEELALLEALDARELRVGLLTQRHQVELLQERLGLARSLAAEVGRRTSGNPLFAVQLVGDWVQREVLRSTDEGFVLEAEAPLPDNVHSVWSERVERLLAERPDSDRVALELAACLGQEVSDAEWRGVCALRQLPKTGLEEVLIRQGLARRHPEGAAWSFAHGMLRESIERRAREQGRWKEHALTCAKAMGRGGDDPARLGKLLVEAEKARQALAPLLEGAQRALTSNDFQEARMLLAVRVDALTAAKMPASDPIWGEGELLELRMARLQVDRAGIERWGDKLMASAQRYGWTRLECLALVERASADRKLGAIDEAFERLTRVEHLCTLEPDPEALGLAAQIRGVMLTQMGELSRARGQLRRALTLLSDDPVYVVQCTHLLALVARYEGRSEQAKKLVLRALQIAESRGIRYLMPMCKLGLGEDARLAGNPIEAERWYREAEAGFESIGSTDAVTARLNIGLALMEQQRWSEARPLLASACKNFEEQGHRTYLAAAHVSLLPCAAHDEDWTALAQHLDSAKTLIEETSFTDYDIPRFCGHAAQMAEDAGETFHAMRCWALCAREWKRLGREAEAETAAQRAKKLNQVLRSRSTPRNKA